MRLSEVAVLIFLGVCVVARADSQEPRSTAPSDGLQILRNADAAIGKLQGFSYKARAWAEGTVRPLFPQMEATVTGMRVPGGKNSRFRIERTDPAATQRIVCDGEQVLITENLGRRVLKTTAAEIDRLDTYNLVFLSEFTLPRPFDEELFRSKIAYLRTENFDGKACQLVEARMADGQWVEWTIGAEDGLPRRVRRGFRSARTTSGFVLELNDLKADPTFGPQEFQLGRAADNAHRAFPTGWRVASWKIQDQDGTSITIESLNGRVVVLDFWSVGCMSCREHMRDILGFTQQFENRPVTILGVNAFERPANDPKAFMADNGFTYKTVLNGDDLARQFLVDEAPATYVLSPDGRVLGSVFELHGEETLRNAIDRGLEQLTAQVPTSRPSMR